MKRYKWWFMLAGVFALGLILVFGNRIHNETGIQKEDLNSILKETQEQAKDLKSYTFVSKVEAGTVVTVELKSRVVRDDEVKKLVDITWNSTQTSGNSTVYSDKTGLFIFQPETKKWVTPDEEPVMRPFVEYFWRQTSLMDPIENIVIAKEGHNKVKMVSNNANTTVMEVEPGVGSLPDFKKKLPPQFYGLNLKNVKQIYTIEKKKFTIQKYEVKADVSFFGISTMKFNAVSTPSAFNKTKISIQK